jgi:inosose dehydratase
MTTGVKLSAAPIDWGVAALVPDNPSPDALLDCVRDAGYVGCELGTHGYFGASDVEIDGYFAPRGLAVSASWYDVDLAKPLSAMNAAEIDLVSSLLEASGADVINISAKMLPERIAVVGRVPSFPETWWSDDDWAQVPKTLADIQTITGRRGVRVAVHQHVGTHLESAAEMRRLIDVTRDGTTAFCLDTGHLLLGGNDPVALLDELGDRVIHVHAKDVDGPTFARLRTGDLDYVAAVGQGLYCDLGRGIVDWTGLKRGLDATAFTGWVVAEQDRPLVPGSRIPFEANKRNYRFLAELFHS